MKTLEDHISEINAACSAQDVFDRFVKIIHGYGYNQVSYGCATDCPTLGLKKRHGHISNFSSEWLKHYAQNRLSEVDPVHIHALKARTPAYWSQCELNAPVKSIQLMRDAGDAGLKSGIIVPLYDIASEISMVSVARDEVAQDETMDMLAHINLLSVYFYESYKSFLKKPVAIELTLREYEILNWAAEGKTDLEISSIIMVSSATVRYHWNNIFKKLNAHGRVYAVSKAMKTGLITPYNIAC